MSSIVKENVEEVKEEEVKNNKKTGNKFIDSVILCIRARYPIIGIESFEEYKLMNQLNEIAKMRKKTLKIWSVTHQFYKDKTKEMMIEPDPTECLNNILKSEAEDVIYVMKDMNEFLKNIVFERRLRDAYKFISSTNNILILTSPCKLKIPSGLDKEIYIIETEYPGSQEIEGILTAMLENLPSKAVVNLTDTDKINIVLALKGLSSQEIIYALKKTAIEDEGLNKSSIRKLMREKEQFIKKDGILEYKDAKEGIEDIGGLENLKDWLKKRINSFSVEARDYKLPIPKGVLLIGQQGCGKSLASKVIASYFGFPLLRLDVGAVFGGIVGESEKNIRKVISTSESMSPVVLWTDEIDKGFSGLGGSGESDGGTTKRVLSSFLTWAQDKEEPVFLVATANNIESLPPEVLRKGRFDEIFFIDLPTKEERMQIFKIHINKFGRNADDFDLTLLASETGGFSGAEIREAIIDAMYNAFDESREFTTIDIRNSILSTVPLSKTFEDKLNAMREWAKGRARFASKIEEKTEKIGSNLEF